MTGKVKWFNDAKGFGFIEADDGTGDIFAHYSYILCSGFKTLVAGQKVEFDVYDSKHGREAKNIKVVT